MKEILSLLETLFLCYLIWDNGRSIMKLEQKIKELKNK